jgi:type VI protein secretion system component VasK
MKKKNTILVIAVALIFFAAVAYWLWSSKYVENLISSWEIKQIQKQSTSDEIEAIEKDLQETDLSGLDKELEDIEAELNATY